MSVEPITLAYLAGIIDADGFISAHKKKHRSKVYCGPLIGIAGTSREPHDLAKSVWGGSFFIYTPKNAGHRIQFQWQAVGKNAAKAIADIFPYLRSKNAQAELALEMWRLIDAGMHRTNGELAIIAQRVSDLNLRHPPLKQMTRKAPHG